MNFTEVEMVELGLKDEKGRWQLKVIKYHSECHPIVQRKFGYKRFSDSKDSVATSIDSR